MGSAARRWPTRSVERRRCGMDGRRRRMIESENKRAVNAECGRRSFPRSQLRSARSSSACDSPGQRPRARRSSLAEACSSACARAPRSRTGRHTVSSNRPAHRGWPSRRRSIFASVFRQHPDSPRSSAGWARTHISEVLMPSGFDVNTLQGDRGSSLPPASAAFTPTGFVKVSALYRISMRTGLSTAEDGVIW